MRVVFKFRESAPPDERERVVAILRERGAQGVERLFPDAGDEELASLFVVEAGRGDAAARILEVLRGSDAVEYAEEEVRRKLVS